MLSVKSAVRKYRDKLSPELAKRYGGGGPYTKAQVGITVQELRLSNRHIRYAYVMFCDNDVLEEENLNEADVSAMLKSVAAAGGGIAAVPGDADGGGFGDGGGGGDG